MPDTTEKPDAIHDRVMAFVHKRLPDPFYLEGTTSISIRDVIFREASSNILTHREHTNAFPANLMSSTARSAPRVAAAPVFFHLTRFYFT